jgi:predicted CXXCH cytochrome family protein
VEWNVLILSRLTGFRSAAALVVLSCVSAGGIARAGAFSGSAHGDLAALPKGCGSCHVGHGTPQTKMFVASEETTCLRCHGGAAWQNTAQGKGLLAGTGPAANIAAEFNKASHHPLPGYAAPSTVSSTFARSMTVVASAPNTAHCSDCHDPHYAVKAVRGGAIVDTTQPKQIADSRGRRKAEYTICLSCHGSTATVNIQQLMSAGNASYHPLTAPGRNMSVPSLIQPYTAQSCVNCTSCHGSDQGNILGPHGSAFAPILKANYTTDDPQTESAFTYGLCYLCHNRTTVLSPASFSLHQLHITQQRAACYTCHDSHGSTQYPHLIHFNPRVVLSNSRGQLSYQSLGVQRGQCNLLCHGVDHVNRSY